MKYNNKYIRDVMWYFSMRHTFNFDGTHTYYNKKGNLIIVYDRNGIDGIHAFYLWDSQGVIKPTRHPNILHTLLKTKGSTNLHIKMYAEDLADCNWNKIEMRALCIKFKAPSWFRTAIENQRSQHTKTQVNERSINSPTLYNNPIGGLFTDNQ
jgi:hypothetical protein